MRRLALILAAAAALFVVSTGEVLAQERVASNGPWIAQCRADRVAGKSCELQAVHDVRKPPLANFWLTYTLKERQFSVVGAPCPASGRLWVDKLPAANFEACAKCTCQMRPEDSARLFDLARGGKSIFLELKDAKGTTLGPFETKLRDFDKTFRAATAVATAK